jgi:hypothetical protein
MALPYKALPLLQGPPLLLSHPPELLSGDGRQGGVEERGGPAGTYQRRQYHQKPSFPSVLGCV